jgi:hypothetical protein
MEDGIDLTYDMNDGVYQVVVRYRKLVVTRIGFLRLPMSFLKFSIGSKEQTRII